MVRTKTKFATPIACCLSLLASSIFLAPPASAQDAARSEALVTDWYEKLNHEDTSFFDHVID